MGFRDRKKQQERDEETPKTIEINAEMQGSLTFKDPVDLKINGEFSGKLDVSGSLTIGSKARVRADVNGDYVVIAGNVEGNITVHNMLTLMPTAHLVGDIVTPKLNIVEGAVFEGRSHMINDEAEIEQIQEAAQAVAVPQEDAWSLDEVAGYLEIEKNTIIQLANNGKIPAWKEGDVWKFERRKIDEWASSGKV